MPQPKPPPPFRKPESSDARYEPLNTRRRLLLLALAIATAITIVLTLLDPLWGPDRSKRVPTPDVARCAPGQTEGCVGGTASVILPASGTAR